MGLFDLFKKKEKTGLRYALTMNGNTPITVAQVLADCASIGHPLTQYQPYTPI